MRRKLQALSQQQRYRLGGRLCRALALTALFLLAFLSLDRLLELAVFGRSEQIPSSEIMKALWLGFRFDLSVVCYLLVVPFLFLGPALVAASARVFNFLLRVLRFYLTFTATLVVFICLIDFIYYTYFQDHLNIMVFGFLDDDTVALLRTFLHNYPVFRVLLGFAVVTYLIYKLVGGIISLRAEEDLGPARPSIFGGYVFGILLLSMGARGSFGLFPLGVADATISNRPFVNYMAFSGLHSLHRAVKLRLRDNSSWNTNERTYGYHDAKTAAQDFLGVANLPDSPDPLSWFQITTPKNDWAKKTRPNVVVLMMESFGSSWLKYDSPDFDLLGDLRGHFHEDSLFMNFVPSMTATIGSLSALMINTPHRPDGGFLTEGRYLQVPFRTAPARIYKQQGYHTRFIYGGAIGWRDIDKFARTQGFESVEGDFAVESKLGRKLEKHDWGLFDEDVWDYLQKTLGESGQPEMVVVMTTTNHPPYQLPSTYHPKNLQLPDDLKARLNVDQDEALARFRAFQYSNQKLGEFLTRFKASPLASKTIVGVTGDHGFLLANFDQSELLQKWQVPFYLYLPPGIRPAKVDTKVFGSHADIFPTLMPLSLSEAPIYALGKNLLDPDVRHDAFHFSRLALNQDGAVIVENAQTTRYLHWQDGVQRLQEGPATPELETLAKRYKALMSFLDEYYEFERKNSRGPHENPGR